MAQDFNFYVSNLELAILDLLEKGNPATSQPGMAGVKQFATYSGDLDHETLLAALKALAPRLPLVLVSYGSGTDKREAATGLLDKEPIEIEHSCDFIVIVASNDMRGEKARKTTAYKMVGEARQLIGGIQFEVEVEGEDEPIQLNHQPFIPDGVETISQLKDLTAHAAHFRTTFKELLPDRRVVVKDVKEILLELQAQPHETVSVDNGENLPGVHAK